MKESIIDIGLAIKSHIDKVHLGQVTVSFQQPKSAALVEF